MSENDAGSWDDGAVRVVLDEAAFSGCMDDIEHVLLAKIVVELRALRTVVSVKEQKPLPPLEAEPAPTIPLRGRHPLQPPEWDGRGVLRFKRNALVDFLLETSNHDLNALRRMNFSEEDWDQFNQLIGYSVSGCPFKNEKDQAEADERGREYVEHHPVDPGLAEGAEKSVGA